MIHAFAFIGEFGYELLNWQGVIRKWAKINKKPDDKIYIFSRRGLESLYEFADEYYDISDLDSYKNTVADCYSAYVWQESDLPFDDWPIISRGKHLDDIKNDIKQLVDSENIDWTFSCDYVCKNGFHFGLGGPGNGSIYSGRLNLDNNEYVKINPTQNNLDKLQSHINIDLNEPYVLCQTGYRPGKGYTNKSKVKIDHNMLCQVIDTDMPVLFLDFDSGRYWDSYSNFDQEYDVYKCNSFNEQATLILNAAHCVFTTEGDFRSHLYLPPMLGKDVEIVASHEVLSLPSASHTFWNDNIFHFGGHMKVYEYEQLIKLYYDNNRN